MQNLSKKKDNLGKCLWDVRSLSIKIPRNVALGKKLLILLFNASFTKLKFCYLMFLLLKQIQFSEFSLHY